MVARVVVRDGQNLVHSGITDISEAVFGDESFVLLEYKTGSQMYYNAKNIISMFVSNDNDETK
jgi:hypothetical protein